MAFVNEYIRAEDKQRYDIASIKRPPLFLQSISTSNWTIDRDRDVFLIWTAGGNEDERNAVHFALHWKGQLCHVKLIQSSTGNFNTHTTTTWKLDSIGIPPGLEGDRDQVVAALKDALTVYRVGGIGVPVASHEAKFDF